VLPASCDKHVVSGAGAGKAIGDARRRELCRCPTHGVLGGNVPQHHAAAIAL